MDIDRRERLNAVIKFLAFCAFGAANLLAFIKGFWLQGLLMIPAFAWFASRYLVHGLFDDAPYWRRWLMYRKWNGVYYEFDGRQLRVDDFGGDLRTMPLIAVADLENHFKDKARFRIREQCVPATGLLENIAAIPADKAVYWAQAISRTNNGDADKARKLALYIDRHFVQPKLKQDHLDTLSTPNAELWGLKPRHTTVSSSKIDEKSG